MNSKPKTYAFLIWLLLLIGAFDASAQETCFSFDDLSPERIFGPEFGQEAGDKFLTQGDLALSLSPFYYADGSQDLMRVFVYRDSSLLDNHENLLFPSNANITLNSPDQTSYPESVCTEFFYYDGHLNLGINGQRPLYFEDLNALLALDGEEIFPGVTLSIQASTTTDELPIFGSLCLKGDFSGLTIGGQEFAIDNLCWITRSPEPCRWDQVQITPKDCTPNGIFYLTVDFVADWANPSGTYYVQVDGEKFGPYAYADGGQRVGPISPNDADLYEVLLYDGEDPNCRTEKTIRWNCSDPPCPVTEVIAYIDRCPNKPTPEVVVDFKYQEATATRFSVLIEGLLEESFSTDELPLRLPLPVSLPTDFDLQAKVCLDVPGFGTPCCFEVKLVFKDCEQDDTCLEFEELAANALFGDTLNDPGTIAFQEDGVPVGISRFQLDNGQTDFGYAKVSKDAFEDRFRLANGQYLVVSNANLTFYLSRTQKEIRQVCFDFFEGGGLLNLSINGSEPLVLRSFKELLDSDAFPEEIEIGIDYDSTGTNQRQGTLCLTGKIEQLTIGGQELGLDNVCFDYGTANTCRIDNLIARPTDCGPNGDFYVYLDFDQDGPKGESFSVYRPNGLFIERFAYDSLPAKVGPFNAYSRELLYLIVQDDKYPDCSEKILVDKPTECVAPCGLAGLQVDVLECYEQLRYDLLIDLARFPDSLANTSGFQLFIDGVDYGRYAYSELPLTLTGVEVLTEATVFPVEICGITPDDASCCLTYTVRKPTDCLNRCGLGELAVNILECYEDIGAYALEVDMSRYDTLLKEQQFLLTVDGQEIGAFPFSALPLKLDSVPVLTDGLSFSVELCARNTDVEACCVRTEIRKDQCGQPCSLGQVHIDEKWCTDAGQLYLTVDFEYEGQSEYFFVYRDNREVGKYRYADLPVNLGPFGPTSSGAPLKLKFYDSQNRDCYTELSVSEFPCSGADCKISDLRIVDRKCDEDGLLYLGIDFAYHEVSDSFTLWQNGNVIGTYRYDQLPVEVGPYFPPIAANQLYLEVYDSKNDACGARLELPELKCDDPQDPCRIGELHLEQIECNSDGEYFVGLDFAYKNTSDSFLVATENSDYQRYHYQHLPIKLGPFKDPMEALEVKVKDLRFDDCTQSGVIEDLDCAPKNCVLNDLHLEQLDCNDQGEYYVRLDFEHKYTSDSFLVAYNGSDYRRYHYKHLPIKLGPFDGPVDVLEVKIKDLKSDDCFLSGILESLDCEQKPCAIKKAKVDDVVCTNTGTYDLTLTYEGYGLEEDAILLATFSSGYQFRFRAGENPVRITDIPLPEAGMDMLKLCAVNQAACCFSLDYHVECQNDCGLSDLEVKASDCDTQGRFDLKVDFAYASTSDGFTLFLNNRAYGNYKYEELPITVENLQGGPNAYYQVTVRDFANFACKLNTRIEAPNCTSGCALEAVRLETSDCINGQFTASVYPQLGHPTTTGSFVLFIDGDLYGPYAYGRERIDINGLPATGERYDVLLVDLDDPTCFAHTDFVAPACSPSGEECMIDDLDIEVVTCYGNNRYQIRVDFWYDHPTHNSFDLLGPDGQILVGDIALDRLPVLIDVDLTGSGSSTVLGVCIKGNDECCVRQEVQRPDCDAESDCFLDRINVRTTECDSNGQIYIILESGLEASSNLALEILINEQVLDSIRFDLSDTVRLGPIDPNLGRDIFLLLSSLTSNACIREVALTLPQCVDDSDIWPGDANQDNIANYIDLINIGVAYGARGVARTNNRTDWQSVPGSAWNQFFTTGLNYKHADCNGDGLIDARDIGVILDNYNQTNGVVEAPDTLPFTDLDPPIRLDLPPGGYIGRDPRMNIPIILGDAQRPVTDLYGVAFVIEFDPEVIIPSTVEVEVMTSWLGVPGVNLASIDYTDVQKGRVEVAISRTDQNEVSGYGPIAMLRGIKDDIAGITTDIHMRHGRRTRIDLEEDGLGGGGFQLFFAEPGTEPDLQNSLNVFPNPTESIVRVTTSYPMPIESLQILSVDGRALSPLQEQTDWISVADLPKGIYILEVQIDGQVLHEKVLKR